MEPTDVTDEASAIAWALAHTDGSNGDDAAIIRIGGGATCVSTDSCIEGIHLPTGADPRQLGRRAVARALSDLAAMGAMPAGLTCAVHVPAGRWSDAAVALAGACERAAEQGAPVVGGDFTRIESHALALVVTVIGRRAGGAPRFVARSGMRDGDGLWVTGAIGRAALHGAEPPDRLCAGAALAPHAHAMIDVSDGLARDAVLLADASGVGATIALDLVPVHPEARGIAADEAIALGDDYELLVALADDAAELASAALARIPGAPTLTRIGTAASAIRGVSWTRDGAPFEPRSGFIHE